MSAHRQGVAVPVSPVLGELTLAAWLQGVASELTMMLAKKDYSGKVTNGTMDRLHTLEA